MYMNLKPNQHTRISFNTTTMTSLELIHPLYFSYPPSPNLIFRSGPHPQLFWAEMFILLPKIGGGGGAATMQEVIFLTFFQLFHQYSIKLFIYFFFFLNLAHFPIAQNFFLVIWYSYPKTMKYLVLLILIAK